MNNHFYASYVIHERQKAIDKSLATRHMLKEAGFCKSRAEKSKQIVWRFAPVAIVISLLVYYFVN